MSTELCESCGDEVYPEDAHDPNDNGEIVCEYCYNEHYSEEDE